MAAPRMSGNLWGVRSKVSTRKRVQRLNPGQYIAPPAGAAILPPQEYPLDEWDQDSPAALAQRRRKDENSGNLERVSATLLPDEGRVVPPFSGDGDPELVARRNFAATATPLKPLQRSLLPYPIRRSAARSLLYGGVRTTGLCAPYPDLAVTRSEHLALPTVQQERRDLQWDAADSGMYLQAQNMHPQLRLLAWHNRCVELDRRLRNEMEAAEQKVYATKSSSGRGGNGSKPIIFKNKNIRFVQPHSSTLRVEPYTAEEWQRILAESAEAAEVSHRSGNMAPALHTQRDAFMPFQTMRPHGYGSYSPAGSRTNQYGRHAQMELVQERLNRKGFGWKPMQNKMWQQDTDTYRYTPDRGYNRNRGQT